MKPLVTAALAGAFLALSAGQVSAQFTIGVGAAPTFPVSDYGDENGTNAKVGYMGYAGLGYAIGDSGLGVGLNGYFGSNSHEGSDDKTNLYGVVAGVTYAFATGGSLVPSLFGIVGTMTHAFKPASGTDSSETELAYGGGAELGFPLGGIGGFVHAWYLTASFEEAGVSANTSVLGVGAGVTIPLGGGGM